MKDTWSWANEIVQNIIGIAVVATYLYLVITGSVAPMELKVFAAAVMVFYGFRVYKASQNGTIALPTRKGKTS